MFTVNEILKVEDKNILTKYTSRIPVGSYGPDRVEFLSDQVDKMPLEEKHQLNHIMNELLAYMYEKEASDIEIGGYGCDGNVWFRIYGRKDRVTELPTFTPDEAALIILSLLNEKQRTHLLNHKNLDFSYMFFNDHLESGEEIRFRADAYYDVDKLAMNMRSIIPQLRELHEYEFHPNILNLFSYDYIKQGLTLITGITGSGKSTTLDAIIDWHNKNESCHIVNLASPIEYLFKSNKCLIRQREVPRDVISFEQGVIQALRQDLDMMIIGEMRDPATIMAALEVTDTGHKVFSTLHTSSAVESLDRIVAEFHESEQERVRNRLADVLISVISQKLVPDREGKLLMAKEVLVVTPNVKAAIKNNNTSEIYLMINQGENLGMVTMEQDLKRLYLENKITLETALHYANNKTFFQQIIGGY